MMEFVRQGHERCDDIERASKTIAGLHKDIAELQTRIAPLAAADDGVVSRVKELSTARDRLVEEIGSIEQTPQGPLAARVQKFTDDKQGSRRSPVTARYAVFQAGDAPRRY